MDHHRGRDGRALSSGDRLVLTVRYELLGVERGHTLLDLGCGAGRHTFEALKRGVDTVSVDLDDAALKDVKGMSEAMRTENEIPDGTAATCAVGDALGLPFADETFDRVIASEVLEHIAADERAMKEIARVLKPGGKAAITVPRWWTEAVNWGLSREYRSTPGGHVRIYRRSQLHERLRRAGLRPFAAHHAHAFHSPYWWLRSIVGISREDAKPVRAYHRFLVWDITNGRPEWKAIERAFNPIMGKSVAIYAAKDPSASDV